MKHHANTAIKIELGVRHDILTWKIRRFRLRRLSPFFDDFKDPQPRLRNILNPAFYSNEQTRYGLLKSAVHSAHREVPPCPNAFTRKRERKKIAATANN